MFGACNLPLLVNRRIGGLEKANNLTPEQLLVNRRIGGLEMWNGRISTLHPVNRRIGGLEITFESTII